MDIRKNRLSTEAEQSGVWIPVDDETELLIARWMNPRHRACLQRKLEPHKLALRHNTMSEEKAALLEKEVMAEAILLDWKGMQEDGKTLKFSVENAKKLLCDPEMSWFCDQVKEVAQDISLFRERDIEDAEENVKKS